MGRSSPGLNYGQFNRLLRKWGCRQVRTARGGGHQIWEAPNGVQFTIQGRNPHAEVIFAILTGATAALNVTIDEFKRGPQKVKTFTAPADDTYELTFGSKGLSGVAVVRCNNPHHACFCVKGRGHGGDHLCNCGESWEGER